LPFQNQKLKIKYQKHKLKDVKSFLVLQFFRFSVFGFLFFILIVGYYLSGCPLYFS